MQYQAALERYRAGDFAAAELFWRDRVTYPHGGGASPPLTMAQRCVELLREPPAAWDGVFVKTTK